MRLIKFSLALTLLPVVAGAQTWEKRIAPGFTYIEVVEASIPRVTHVLKIAKGAPGLSFRPELAKGTIFPSDGSNACQPISSIVRRTNALAAINADFFPFTGDPLGLMIQDGKLVSVPIFDRATAVWRADSLPSFGVAKWSGKVTFSPENSLVIDGVNQKVDTDQVVVVTSIAGLTQVQKPNTILVANHNALKPNEDATLKVERVLKDVSAFALKPEECAIAFTGSKAKKAENIEAGAKIQLNLSVEGLDTATAESAIGGGPMLLKDGAEAVDWQPEKFKEAMALKRHPRTAMGLDKAGNLYLVVVEGRQPQSDGATLPEMAKIMKDIGCREAINLDGGGSTSMNLAGLTINRPSEQQVERPIANALIVVGPKPEESADELIISFPAEISLTAPRQAEVATKAGVKLRNADVIWTARGNAWIDQGGVVRALKAGPASIFAYVKGKTLRAKLAVVDGSKAGLGKGPAQSAPKQ